MLSARQVSAQIEYIANRCMRVQKPLSLPNRLELSHPSFSNPGRLMGLLCPIILILFGAVDHIGYQFAMGNTIAAQFICNDLPGFTTVATQ